MPEARAKTLVRRARSKSRRVAARYFVDGRRAHQASAMLAPLLPPILVIDIGASHFPHERWRTMLHAPTCHWVLVDPHADSLAYVAKWQYPSTAEAVAVGIAAESGRHTLYETAVDTGSSLLPPELSTTMERRYGPEGRAYFFPVHEKSVECSSLRELLSRFPDDLPVALKIDTQGTELSILESVVDLLGRRIFLVESEATLLSEPVYRNSGRYWRMQALMEEAGFDLAYLDVIYRQPVGAFAELARMPHECDAAFTIRPDLAAGLQVAFQMGLLASYVDYRLPDEALLLLDQGLQASLGASGHDLHRVLSEWSRRSESPTSPAGS